jgi:copper chaperone CopZ
VIPPGQEIISEKAEDTVLIVGMTCASCAARVKRTLQKKVPGVISVSVISGTETTALHFDTKISDPEAMDLDFLKLREWIRAA